MSSMPYNDNFFDRQEQGISQSARIVVPILLQLIEPKSVIDIGCGRGAWLNVFGEHGIKTLRGLDGNYINRSKLLIDSSCFDIVDLTKPFEIDRQYDLAICLEVVEHLPAKAGQSLVATLTRTAPFVLFSAAVPGQGGIGHINEQWPFYWNAVFSEHGFRRLDPVRRHIWQDNRVEAYYRQNIFLYASVQSIVQSTALQNEAELASHMPVDIVLKSVLRRYRSVSGVLQLLPQIVLRSLRHYFNR